MCSNINGLGRDTRLSIVSDVRIGPFRTGPLVQAKRSNRTGSVSEEAAAAQAQPCRGGRNNPGRHGSRQPRPARLLGLPVMAAKQWLPPAGLAWGLPFRPLAPPRPGIGEPCNPHWPNFPSPTFSCVLGHPAALCFCLRCAIAWTRPRRRRPMCICGSLRSSMPAMRRSQCAWSWCGVAAKSRAALLPPTDTILQGKFHARWF